MPEAGVCAIVLAAGQGSRYRAAGGADKLLAASLAAASSPPVLAATLANFRGIAERLLVVTRADNLPLRDWLSATGWDKTPPPPALPAEVIAETQKKYLEAYELLTGSPLQLP